MTPKKYKGTRTDAGCRVTVDGRQLGKRLDLFRHSPTGFEWGYQGSGPAQLALAILARELDDDERAVKLHQEFKRKVIASLPLTGWTLSSEYVRTIVRIIEIEGSADR